MNTLIKIRITFYRISLSETIIHYRKTIIHHLLLLHWVENKKEQNERKSICAISSLLPTKVIQKHQHVFLISIPSHQHISPVARTEMPSFLATQPKNLVRFEILRRYEERKIATFNVENQFTFAIGVAPSYESETLMERHGDIIGPEPNDFAACWLIFSGTSYGSRRSIARVVIIKFEEPRVVVRKWKVDLWRVVGRKCFWKVSSGSDKDGAKA